MTETTRVISFHPSSNNTPSSTLSYAGIKRKAVPEEKPNDKLPEYYSISLLVIDYGKKMGDKSGGNCSMIYHTLYQHACDSNNGDVSSGYGFINIHTIY